MLLIKTTYFGGRAADDFSFGYELVVAGVSKALTQEEYYTFLESGVPVKYVDHSSVRNSKSSDELYS